MSVIEVSNLKKYYGTHRGIEDVSFTVGEGEIFGFIGPNGAGKSTTLRILMGILKADSGCAKIFGRDVFTQSDIIKRDVGYIPSDSIFYGDLTVNEILSYSASIRRRGAERINRLAERFNLDLKSKIKQLSFGNRKKISIVLALLHQPKLLIMDEPTSGLDPLYQSIFFETIEECRANGSTVVLSTHILSDIQKFCSRAAIIKDGKIIADQSMQLLKKNMVSNVKMIFDGEPPQIDLEGVSNRLINGSELSFDYSGDYKKLLQLALNLNLTGFFIHEADIEKVFMHYYK